MQSSTWKMALAFAATSDLAVFGAIIVGGNSCGRGDGCLFYSGLFLFALVVAGLVLIPSAIVWIRSKPGGAEELFFRVSTVALFIVAVSTLASVLLG